MEDYPRTIVELERRFSTEEACRDYLYSLRWPEGFACPRCGAADVWRATRGRLVCRGCRHQASVTAGTIFQDTHKPLVLWFRAIWHVVGQKNGTSAVSIQNILGLGGYSTAWTWLHKLRRAMVRPGRDRLRGRVEIDETFVGGPERDVGRRTEHKSIVLVAAEENGSGIGRIRLAHIPDTRKKTLHQFIQNGVARGATLHTDGLVAYRGLDALGYTHHATALLREKDVAAARACCPASIAWPRSSNGGCWEPTREPCMRSTWITTSTNSPFGSTAARRGPAASSFTASCSKPFRSSPCPITCWLAVQKIPTTTSRGKWSQLDNHIK